MDLKLDMCIYFACTCSFRYKELRNNSPFYDAFHPAPKFFYFLYSCCLLFHNYHRVLYIYLMADHSLTSLEDPTIVIDIGSHCIKVGTSNDDIPVISPNLFLYNILLISRTYCVILFYAELDSIMKPLPHWISHQTPRKRIPISSAKMLTKIKVHSN